MKADRLRGLPTFFNCRFVCCYESYLLMLPKLLFEMLLVAILLLLQIGSSEKLHFHSRYLRILGQRIYIFCTFTD